MTVDLANKILRQVTAYTMEQKKYLKNTLESESNSMSWLWIAGNILRVMVSKDLQRPGTAMGQRGIVHVLA